jgi:hypothetical protein
LIGRKLLKFSTFTVDFTKLWPQMFRTSLRSSQVRCKIRKFMLEFTSQFVNKVPDWSLKWKKPIKCVVYKLVCESHYELLNFATNLRTSQRSSEHLWPKFREINCNNDIFGNFSVRRNFPEWKLAFFIDKYLPLSRHFVSLMQERVGIVYVSNRADCCWSRLSSFEIRVGNSLTMSRNTRCGATLSLNRGETREIICNPPLDGRYVSISMENSGGAFLTLCEVAVYARKHFQLLMGRTVEPLLNRPLRSRQLMCKFLNINTYNHCLTSLYGSSELFCNWSRYWYGIGNR